MSFNIDIQSLMYAVYAFPIFVGIFLLFKYRAAILAVKSTLVTIFLIVGTASSLAFSGVKTYSYFDKIKSAETKKSNFNWRAYYLPGKWDTLAKELTNCSFYAAKCMAIEKFASDDAKYEPMLTAQGFNYLLNLSLPPGDHVKIDEYLNRINTALRPYVQTLPTPERNPATTQPTKG